MMDSASRPAPHVHIYVTDDERRRRLRRRRLVLLSSVAVAVAVVAAGGVWALHALGGGASGPNLAAASIASGSPTPSVSPSATRTPSATPTPSASPTTITIGWVGDTTPGSKYGEPPNGGRALFGSMRALLSKPDLMIANLEGTYSTPGPSKCDGSTSGTCFAFQAPPSYAGALAWSGIDLVNMANNHSMDYLTRGYLQTQATLKKVGVAYAGLPNKITIKTVKGVRVAVMGFSPYPWSAPLNDIPVAAALVRRAAAKADVVIVVMHAGAEGSDRIHTPSGTEIFLGEDRGNVRAFAHAMVNAGADLVLGSGPHVIRGIERYKNRLIAYSLGNFAGWQNFGLGGNLSLSGLLTVKIDKAGHIHGGRWLSLSVNQPGVPAVDGSNTSAHLVRSLSASDFPKTYRLDGKGYFSAQ
jgi:hypothetical protein